MYQIEVKPKIVIKMLLNSGLTILGIMFFESQTRPLQIIAVCFENRLALDILAVNILFVNFFWILNANF